MHCLITGGAGFIGSNLARYILAQNAEVTIFDNLSTGRMKNLNEILGKVRFIEGDILNILDVRRAMMGCSVVFHLAALGSVPRSVKEPIKFNDVNVSGTINVLEAARALKVKRVIFAASSSAYGDQPASPKQEEMYPRPKSPYASSKVAGEFYMRAYADTYGLETLCLRYFNVFGPRQSHDNVYAAVVPSFIRALLQGKQVTVYGDGEQSRDFCYIDNVCKANWLAAHAPSEQCDGRPINIACGRRVVLNEFVARLQTLLGTDITPSFVPIRNGDIKHSLADVSLAKKTIGYEPTAYFYEGLQRTVDWYREQV